MQIKRRAWYKRKSLYAIIIVVIYVMAKLYVLYTPSPRDDHIPDDIKDAVINLADNQQPIA